MKRFIQRPLKASLGILLIIGAMACSKDDAAPPSAEELIIGTWHLIGVSPSGGGPTEALNQCEGKSYFVFETNGMVTQANYYLDGSECKGDLLEHEYALYAEDEKIMFISSADGSTTTANILVLDKTNFAFNLDSSGIIARFEKR